MADPIYVIPTADLIVPDNNEGDRFPPEGREVIPDNYIYRRIAEGCLTIGVAPVTATATKAE